ncbi:TetR/AcrR family transcriptional regulator [Streptomyces buecherae]|uniref:TetR/AcrR family transcriptional regulator n=1 Tax=Streptomyces buecherae TaxID=2763006 RepID=UPI001C27B532|nr:TetR/AcrR family transcriptional regulator [Streptomyces buecherae]
MAFTAKGRATRQRIIEGAAGYLRSDDPGNVTLDDIRAATSTSKSQLFHYFPNGKEELLLAVAHYESDRVLADQQPFLGSLDSWDAWEQWRRVVIGRYRAQGPRCPLAALIGQVSTVPGAADVTASLLRRWQEHLRRGILAMQESGEVAPHVDADRTAAAFVAGTQGGVIVLRSTGDTFHLEAVLDALISHLRGGGPARPAAE